MTFRPCALALAIATLPATALAGHASPVEEVVVTASRTSAPLTVVTDPKAPRQPLPAHDGADYLKTIPGFSVIRKGGSDGDPVLRGMAGSRLNVLLDGDVVLGGCGGRMDPPTAYVFPESFDRITVIKGPQTVLHGPGSTAGTVLFERDHKRLGKTGAQLNASALGGAFDRNDQLLDATAGTPEVYARATATHAHQGDYRDGEGRKVHSQFDRWSSDGALGWTPDDDTLVELAAGHSDGEAAYADRGVDGSKFARDHASLTLVKQHLSETVQEVEARAYWNYIDHVMDNYSLRTPSGMMAARSAMNPDRETLGARLAATLALGAKTEAVVGADLQRNQHTGRMSMDQDAARYQDMARVDDAQFQQTGLFGEVTHNLDDRQRLIAGLRADRWYAKDERDTISLNMMSTAANPSSDEKRIENLTSGFARYEQDLAALPATAYVGVGRSERFPDYWELIGKETLDGISAFGADPEKLTQLDTGLLYSEGKWRAGVSAFYNHIDDYLLIQSGVVKPSGMMGTRTTSITRNVEAHSWGGEAELGYQLAEHWRSEASLAYVRGSNDSDDTSLAQLPPFEARLGLGYDDGTWSAGVLWRLVDAQTHVAVDQGNIVGQDIGESDGFGVVSLNAGWRPSEELQITAGVDNVLDKTYAEHVSRSGEMVAGFEQTERVNEPGRGWWLKAQYNFD